jgi:DNA polymerase I-like protein with 3'-5' exonuclease and polymerase domains
MKFLDQDYNVKIWNREHLGDLIACDTETDLVDEWYNTPEISTFQAYGGGNEVYLVRISDLLLFFNTHNKSDFVYQNAPFDIDVLLKAGITKRRIYGWYDNNQIKDTKILYILLHLALEGYTPFNSSLKTLSKKYLGAELDKAGTERITFGQYIGKPVEDISDAHAEYACIDVIATYQVWLALKAEVVNLGLGHSLLSHDIQVKGDLALNHIYKNGIGFDLESRDHWLADKDVQMKLIELRLAQWGYVRGAKGNIRRFEDALTTLGVADKLPRNENGTVSTKEADLLRFNDTPLVRDYIGYSKLEKETGFVRDINSNRVHPKYTTILNTGRTSCKKPNIQQMPSGGNVRNMFIPKKGNVFIDVDYSAIELATLAQVLYNRYGHSTMRDKINEGKDLHTYYASVLHGCDEKDVTKQQRQEAKAANFGFPGGLGIDTFMQFSAGYGLHLESQQALDMKKAWFDAFPEVKKYLGDELGYVVQETGMVRGKTFYCAEKNTPFQGLAAAGLKLAMYELDKAGYIIAAEVHDQILVEAPKEKAAEMQKTMEAIMISAMKQVVPDVKVGVEGQILERWAK